MGPVERELPEELLELVFSWLPVVGICKVRTLSKTWKHKVDSRDSLFGRYLEETTYPRMFGIVSVTNGGRFSGLVVDAKASTQRKFNFVETVLPIHPAGNYMTTMGAADGGLVCFVSRDATSPKFLLVMNPLTGKSRRVDLPRFQSFEDPNPMPLMLQLVTNRQTSHYKVIVVGYMRRASSCVPRPLALRAHIYNSVTHSWTTEGPEHDSLDRVFAHTYESRLDHKTWLHNLRLQCLFLFNFQANAGLCYFHRTSQDQELIPVLENKSHVVVEKHLFRATFPLWQNRGRDMGYRFMISEFVLREEDLAWVPVPGRWNTEVYLKEEVFLSGVGVLFSYFLDACRGFLLLVINETRGMFATWQQGAGPNFKEYQL